jgi:soluble lytic murein transglycosylase-like protein
MILSSVVLSLFLLNPSRLPELESLILVESGGRPRAVSRVGALGLCQIMPGTWREFSRPGERWDNPRDNRTVARRYLVWIQNTLRTWGDPEWNNPSHMLACYNGGITRFKQVGFRVNRMPRETRVFVQRYQALATKK